MASTGSGRASLSGNAVAVAWILTFALAYVGVGGFLDATAEGIQNSQLGRGLPGLALVALVVSIGMTVVWARGIGAGQPGAAPAPEGIGRRRFLYGGAAVLGGVVGSVGAVLARASGWLTVTLPNVVNVEVVTTDPEPKAEWEDARIRSYRRLGRTGFEVSDISLGSGRIAGTEAGEGIAREAMERGVNYFDTSPDYSDNRSEEVLGRALEGKPRDKMFLATKFCTADGHLQTGSSVEQYTGVVEASLKRLQTDYVDLVHVHSCDKPERLLDPNMHEAFVRLKQQGKARFLGVSTHTPDLELVANTAIDDGRFDVMMLAYHHGAWPQLGAIIERAAKADVGIVAMKTLKGAKHRGMTEFRADGSAYSQAAFKWVLSNPAVACLVVSFFDPQHVDEYLAASGRSLGAADLALLERYDEAITGAYCRPHCGACLDACPEELAINDVLRQRMYFEDYGQEKYAMELYAKLGKRADACASCDAPCTGSCPFGLPIQERMVGAHELLTLS